MSDKMKRVLYLGLSALMIAPLSTSVMQPIASAKSTNKKANSAKNKFKKLGLMNAKNNKQFKLLKGVYKTQQKRIKKVNRKPKSKKAVKAQNRKIRRLAGTYKGWLLYNRAHMNTDNSSKGFMSYKNYIPMSTAGYNSRIASRGFYSRNLVLPKNANLSKAQKKALLTNSTVHNLSKSQLNALAEAGIPMYNNSSVFQSWKTYVSKHGDPLISIGNNGNVTNYKFDESTGYYNPFGKSNAGLNGSGHVVLGTAPKAAQSLSSANPFGTNLMATTSSSISSASSKVSKVSSKATKASSKATSSVASSAEIVSKSGSKASNTVSDNATSSVNNKVSDMTNLAQSTDSIAASQFDSLVDASPLAKNTDNNIISEFQSKPSSAAITFVSDLAKNPSAAKKDKNLVSALSAVSSADNKAVPNLQYSAKPSKAANTVASMDKHLNKSAKKSATSTAITNDSSATNTVHQASSASGAVSLAKDDLSGSQAGNDVEVSAITNLNNADKEVPFQLNGSAPLVTNSKKSKTVLSTDQIDQMNQKPDFGNTFMAYQQGVLKDGVPAYHVISYNGKYDGWVPTNAAKANISGKYITAPAGTFHFNKPSSDHTYALPLGTSFSNPYIAKNVTNQGADNLQIGAARKVNTSKGSQISYYIEDFSNPSINGWVNSNEVSKKVAKNSKLTTPAKTNNKNNQPTKFSLHAEGNQNYAPMGINSNNSSDSDHLNLPKFFSNAQVKALKANYGQDVDWSDLESKFFDNNQSMNSFVGSTSYYDDGGKSIAVPKDKISTMEKQGKTLYHLKYKVDMRATIKANHNAKNGDVLNIYYKVSRVSNNKSKPANNKVSNSGNKSKVLTNQDNKTSTGTVNVPNK